MTTIFETERLVVRPWGHADAERVLDIYSRPEVTRYLESTPQPMASLDEALARIDRWAGLGRDDPTYGVWCLARRAEGLQVGTVLLNPIRDAPDGAVEVGWHLHPDWWGEGYATEAARAALDRGWAAGLREIVAVVDPGNTASAAVCERLGMEHRGRTERYYGAELELYVAPHPAA